MNCPKCKSLMKEVLSRQSVLLDVCSQCRSVWFDEGEINLVAANRNRLAAYYSSGLQGQNATQEACPRCVSSHLFSGTLPEYNVDAEVCPKCRGLILGAN